MAFGMLVGYWLRLMTGECEDMGERPENQKDRSLSVYGTWAEVARSLSDPVRLEIIDSLSQGPRTVESLAAVLGLPAKNISHHLQRLRSAGLVERVKLDRRAIYSLADEAVADFWLVFREFAERRTERNRRIREARADGVTADGLARLLAEERVLVIDVRPAEEFRAGHLPAARSMPLDELERRLPELPRDRLVVAFCRGPYCRLADRAVAALRREGYEALRCSEGVLEWRAAGLEMIRERDTAAAGR